jgi:hypothetical protein
MYLSRSVKCAQHTCMRTSEPFVELRIRCTAFLEVDGGKTRITLDSNCFIKQQIVKSQPAKQQFLT